MSDTKPEQKRGSVLIIDDDEPIREMLRLALEFEGYEVKTADNGQSALEALKRMNSPCLILLDLMMPVMNGWLFMEAIKKAENLSKVQVVILTAFPDRAKGLEDHTVLKKPLDINFLFDIVKSHCLLKPNRDPHGK